MIKRSHFITFAAASLFFLGSCLIFPGRCQASGSRPLKMQDFHQELLTGEKAGIHTISYVKNGRLKRESHWKAGFLNPPSTMVPGQNSRLLPFHLPCGIVSWRSDNPAIATVDQDGNVTAKAYGRANISAITLDGKEYSCKLDVISQEDASQLTAGSQRMLLTSQESTLFMKKKDEYTPKVFYRNIYGQGIASGLSWESSDSSIASVDQDGKITAISDGSCMIQCQSEDASLSFSVNVISDGQSGGSCQLSILSGKDGRKISYFLFKQNAHNYDSYDNYLAWHGCAHCSLATVLGAYNDDYSGVLPNEIISGIEKDNAPASQWKKEHVDHSLRYQMPLSLNGISQLLTIGQVKNEYIPFFTYNAAKEDMISHLRQGNPVIIEVRQRSSKTKKYSKRWTNSYHTMIFLGFYSDGEHVLLCDSVDRSWYDGGQRYKIVTIDDVMEFMFTSTARTESYYYDGAESDGGYIKIYNE